jgi:hypothetical protein
LAAHFRQALQEVEVQSWRGEIARQAIFRLDERHLFLQTTTNAAQLHVLSGLDALEHRVNEFPLRASQPFADRERKLGKLGFKSRA